MPLRRTVAHSRSLARAAVVGAFLGPLALASGASAQTVASPAHTYSPSLSWLDLKPVDPQTAQGKEVLKGNGPFANYQRVLANEPGSYTAWRAFAAAVDKKDGAFTPLEKQIVATVVSAENRCDNCVLGHTAALRQLGADPLWVAQVQINYRKAPLSTRERALADFAVKITRTPWDLGQQDLEALRRVGVSETGLIELAHWTSFFNFNNRVFSALGIEPDRDKLPLSN